MGYIKNFFCYTSHRVVEFPLALVELSIPMVILPV